MLRAARPARSLATLGMIDIVHIYGTRGKISSAKTVLWCRPVKRTEVAPVEMKNAQLLPEAVEDEFFSVEAGGLIVGSIFRRAVKNALEQTMHRLARTRDDI